MAKAKGDDGDRGEFVPLAREFLGHFSEYRKAQEELIKAKDYAAGKEKQFKLVAEQLGRFVGQNVPSKNCIVDGRLVRVEHRPGTTPTVMVEDITSEE